MRILSYNNLCYVSAQGDLNLSYQGTPVIACLIKLQELKKMEFYEITILLNNYLFHANI